MIQSPLLSPLPWLRHGFGTRTDRFSYERAAQLKQIHSAAVLAVSEPGVAGEGDALVTIEPDLDLAIRTADCYPVLLADPKRRAVAVVHAGWRGTAARIVPTAIETMHREFGSAAADLIAAIGPGIGACCYEVGAEVAGQFPASEVRLGHLDLAAANRRQLLEAGVGQTNISVSGLCTFCEAGQFFSYRREKEKAGRMHSFLRIII